ncbi:hypothetical protein EV702DRAFT_1269477 [Suillus placidus]|uniref:Uncharacterized protein n=1 Tax=Suillus placidus TaxID=48579 RepID=A0A9P6ZRG4_9AGAM|nr:hypothetical protein EV702DRAFT_1269477 [Suillus placidus]
MRHSHQNLSLLSHGGLRISTAHRIQHHPTKFTAPTITASYLSLTCTFLSLIHLSPTLPNIARNTHGQAIIPSKSPTNPRSSAYSARRRVQCPRKSNRTW